MEAKELRIGNCVLEKGRLVILHDGFGIDHAHNFEPIQLTEDWLIEFNFEKTRIAENWFSFGHKLEEEWKGYDLIIELRPDGNFYDEYKSVNLKNVHSLQNYYFALTTEELTLK